MDAKMVDLTTLGLTALCLASGALVQSTLGFGMGVVATPLLVSAGYSLPQALAALLPNVFVQTAFSCWRHRDHLPWRDVAPLCLWRYLSLPLGIAMLGVVADQGQSWSRALMGLGLLGVLLVQQFQLPAPRARPRAALTVLTGISSGFLAGLIGMGGPPLVVWAMAHRWPNDRQRCFLWLSFLLILPLQLAVMIWRFGRPWALATGYGWLVVPVVIVIAWSSGLWADNWSSDRLRQAVRLFLLLIAVRLIWQWAGTSL
jgi:uncharacterized membrane protein YfcA